MEQSALRPWMWCSCVLEQQALLWLCEIFKLNHQFQPLHCHSKWVLFGCWNTIIYPYPSGLLHWQWSSHFDCPSKWISKSYSEYVEYSWIELSKSTSTKHSPCTYSNTCTWIIQCSRKTFMVHDHQTFVRWALYILFKFVKSLIRHLGLAIGYVQYVRWFSWTLILKSILVKGNTNFQTWLLIGSEAML